MNSITKFMTGVLKDNVKDRKVYEKWVGKLDTYTATYQGVEEVFCIYRL